MSLPKHTMVFVLLLLAMIGFGFPHRQIRFGGLEGYQCAFPTIVGHPRFGCFFLKTTAGRTEMVLNCQRPQAACARLPSVFSPSRAVSVCSARPMLSRSCD